MKNQPSKLPDCIPAVPEQTPMLRGKYQNPTIATDPLTTILEAVSELNSDAGTELSEITADSSPTKSLGKYINYSQSSFSVRPKLYPLSQFSQLHPINSATASLSPNRKAGSRFSADFAMINNKNLLPLPGPSAAKHYSDILTEKEQKEILTYSDVYYIGELYNKNYTKFEDEEGSYIGNPGDHLAFRYEILETLGKGSFGKVFKCLDHKRNLYLALKVLSRSPRMKILGDIEIKVLEKLNDSDPEDSKGIVKMLQCFEFRRHICIAFELMSYNLYHFIRNNKFAGLEKTLVKRIAVQILIGLRHIHSLGIIHRDLKLENILFKHENKSSIKIIDFGSATMNPTQYYSYVQSRYYRAPEVLLGCGYDSKIDMWSFGCIVIELSSGKSLFPGQNQHDQLHKIIDICGMPPQSLIVRSKKKASFFDEFGNFMAKPKKNSVYRKRELKDFVDENDTVFIDFITRCLEWEPESRISAEEAFKHPWIKSQSRTNHLSAPFRKNTA